MKKLLPNSQILRPFVKAGVTIHQPIVWDIPTLNQATHMLSQMNATGIKSRMTEYQHEGQSWVQ